MVAPWIWQRDQSTNALLTSVMGTSLAVTGHHQCLVWQRCIELRRFRPVPWQISNRIHHQKSQTFTERYLNLAPGWAIVIIHDYLWLIDVSFPHTANHHAAFPAHGLARKQRAFSSGAPKNQSGLIHSDRLNHMFIFVHKESASFLSMV